MKHFPLFILMILFSAFSGCNTSQNHKGRANRLIRESSPYLLQHAYNPVDWYPWGEEALQKAKKENKPMIVSIGYSACHWCHVMERESFEDDSVAAYMNEHFVNIKVDREERPDIDKIYIEAAQMMTGGAGWPLNCITMPDGRPFFAGTYYPRDRWLELLKRVVQLWEEQPEKLRNTANQVAMGLKAGNAIEPAGDNALPDKKQVADMAEGWMDEMDAREGGYIRTPKFPLPVSFGSLLTYHYMSRDPDALSLVKTTLTKMACGGIYDQIGGGFARYSTDALWRVPHFEKMLYDNAQLIKLYSDAWMVTKKPLYKEVVAGTVDFMKNHWLTPEGAFYSSFDADSEGEEGKYYVWKAGEIDSLLGDDAALFKWYYNATDPGNWENGQNILFVTGDTVTASKRFGLTPDQIRVKLSAAKNVLLKARMARKPPALDDKILTSWNALAITGLVKAYRAFDEDAYLDMALNAGKFIAGKMMSEDFRLDRNYKNGKADVNGFLEDYAYTIEAFIELYQVTFDETWLNRARGMTGYVMEHFPDVRTGFFYFTSDLDQKIVTRQIDITDNVMPSANGVMARNLFFLGTLLFDDDFIKWSVHMLRSVLPRVEENTSYYTTWFELLLYNVYDFYEVAIVGPGFGELQSGLLSHFLPNAVFAGGPAEGLLEILKNRLQNEGTWIYVCKRKMCKLPVNEVDRALELMEP